jgi:hypothetical protein
MTQITIDAIRRTPRAWRNRDRHRVSRRGRDSGRFDYARAHHRSIDLTTASIGILVGIGFGSRRDRHAGDADRAQLFRLVENRLPSNSTPTIICASNEAVMGE